MSPTCGLHVLGRDAQRLGQLHGDAGARAADVGRAFDQRHGAVVVDAGRAARCAADVEPEAAGDAAAAVLARPAATSSGRCSCAASRHFDEADARIDGAVDAARPLLGGVLQPELDRVDAELLGQLVDDLLAGERRLRRAGRAVGLRLGLVVADVVSRRPGRGAGRSN